MTQSTSDQRRPFLSAPNPKRYFPAAAIEEARQRIVRSIARSEGPALLVGAAGTGKSLLLAVLAEQFAPRVAVVTLAGAQLCTRRALLQMILCELGLPYRGMDEGELRLSILEHLRGAGGRPRRLLLLVDEADSLPVRLLEELRVLTNVAIEGLPLVSLVLAGGPILEERFADPQLDMFSQRIAARCYLSPLGREETLQYVRSQVAAVGVKPDKLFSDDALEAIHAATGGVPRLVNQLGDQLVWMAEETGCTPFDADLVQQAWSELQQLPAPWNTDAPSASVSSGAATIEFGELDGDGQDDDAGVFCGHEFTGSTGAEESNDLDDDRPASIPIAAGRSLRGEFPPDAFDITFDATEQLLASLGSFDAIGMYAPDPDFGPEQEPEPLEDPAPHAAENPFDEPFDEEEIVLDRYAAFETELLRTAPQVVNRLDRAFAADLPARPIERPPAKPTPLAAELELLDEDDGDEPEALTATAPPAAIVRLHSLPADCADALAPRGELLVIDDDDRPTAAIVQSRQFRRLFSSLESASCVRASS